MTEVAADAPAAGRDPRTAGAALRADLALRGAACRTGIGATLAATDAAWRARIAGFREHPYMVDRAGALVCGVMLADADSEASLLDRMIGHACHCVDDALSQATGGPAARDGPVHLALCLPAARPGALAADPGRTLQRLLAALGDRVQPEAAVVFPRGHAACGFALGWCARQLTQDPAGLGLVVALDSYFEADTLDWLQDLEVLKTAQWPWGMVPGEAAVCLAVAPARADGADPVIGTVAIAHEAALRETDRINTGEGLSRAARLALPAPPRSIDHLLCDMNGDACRADEFAYTAIRIVAHFSDGLEFTTPADCVGDIGAASMALHLALASRMARARVARPPRSVLVLASAETGERAAAWIFVPVSE